RVWHQRHAQPPGQVLTPWIDPGVVRWPVQQTIEHASRDEDAVAKLQQDAPHRARAALFGAHGDERTGHLLPEVFAIILGPCGGPNEIPKCDLFVFFVIALLTTR